MSDIVTIEPATAPTASKPDKEPRISKRLRKAIALLESGECRTQQLAAAKANLSPTYLSRALRKSETQVFIARRRAENIAIGSLRASYRYPDLVFAESEHVAEKAAGRLLEQSGDLKAGNGGTNISINNSISAGQVIGYCIDLSDPRTGQPTTIEARPIANGTD